MKTVARSRYICQRQQVTEQDGRLL